MAFEEAASVAAFVRMEEELTHFGAPRSLRSAARRAANDERRHARIMRALARKAGTKAPAARVAKPKRRTIEAMAIENAVEGCIHETYGALLLRWQAASADDPALRCALTAIADDEESHAALSWTVARWIETRLDEGARARVTKAKARAAAKVGASGLGAALFESLGLA